MRDCNIDHLLPRALGGTNDFSNLVMSCKPCNTGKADRAPTEAELKRRAETHSRGQTSCESSIPLYNKG